MCTVTRSSDLLVGGRWWGWWKGAPRCGRLRARWGCRPRRDPRVVVAQGPEGGALADRARLRPIRAGLRVRRPEIQRGLLVGRQAASRERDGGTALPPT